MVCVASASASTITLDYTGSRHGLGSVTIVAPVGVAYNPAGAGELVLDVKARDGVPVAGETLFAFCADIMTELETSSDFTYEYVFGVTPYGALTRNSLDRLFTGFYAGATTKTETAAFQVAIWEILTDAGGTYDVFSGAFQVASSSITTRAQEMLDGLATAGTGKYRLTFYDGHSNPELVSQSLIAATPVPLPASALLMLAGLGALGALRGSRRS